jgi:hypothetical protein
MKKLICILVFSLLCMTLSNKSSFADTIKKLQKTFPGLGSEGQIKMKFSCTRNDVNKYGASTSIYKYKLYEDKINYEELIVNSSNYKMDQDFSIISKKNDTIYAYKKDTGEVLELDLENSFINFIKLTDSKPDLKNRVTRTEKVIWGGICYKD